MRPAPPARPAASVAAHATYGFESAPGMRHSIRSEGPSPTTRKPAVRLSALQAIVVGANEALWKRLYELTEGAQKAVSSAAGARRPPRKNRNVSLHSIPPSLFPPEKTF